MELIRSLSTLAQGNDQQEIRRAELAIQIVSIIGESSKGRRERFLY
jgi:hypothetical protein